MTRCESAWRAAPPGPLFGRFRTIADNGGFWPAMVCLLLTQSGRGAFTKCSAWPSPVVGAGIEDDDEGALMGFAGSMRANCCPSQLGFAGAWVTPSGISTQGSFSAHQICRFGATQLGSSSVPAFMNAIA